ncbi:MAG: hypothetical protein KDI13_09050 [Alphaproteobacteria bacterium]|nr:hypothetical protein [Alphaproteobacteria bacterium]
MTYIDEFEQSCMGKKKISPSRFREINAELSIGAVLLIGKHRFYKDNKGKGLLWRGLDGREYDLGLIQYTNIMRDYPGFNATSSLALGKKDVAESKVVDIPGSRHNVSVVTMKDGSTGIGPNYRIALRNAAIKMHIKAHFNRYSILSLWERMWGNAKVAGHAA